MTAYAATAFTVVAVPAVAAWVWSGPQIAMGVTAAGCVAYGVMVASFALMLLYRDEGNRFLAAWAVGALARLVALGVTTYAVVRLERLEPAPTLIALAGFFFVLLLLEPVYLRDRGSGSVPLIGRTED